MSETSMRSWPYDWTVEPIENVVDILDSLRKPLNAGERQNMQGPYPYYGANGVVDHVSRWIFDEPLILMAEDGGYFEDYATRPIAYMVSGRCWVNNHAHVLRVRKENDRRWIFYTLVHRDVRSYINSGTRSKLNQADMRLIPVPLPPLGEQRKIAAILSAVDDTIEKAQAVIDELRAVKKAMMQELITQGVPGRYARFKQTGIGKVPEGWQVIALDECIASGRPICYGILMPGRGHEGGVPVVKVKDIKDGRICEGDLLLTSPEIDAQYARSRLREGDILLTIRGTTGRVARVPARLANANITVPRWEG